MSDVFISNLAVSKVARNRRPYGKSDVFNAVGTSQSTGIHIESGRITGLTSVNVVVYFATQFGNIPTGWIKVYRMRQVMSGKWKQQDVLYYHASEAFKNEFGFGLVIESTENLTGVIVEYFFI
jgi:hypothetical protein